MNTKIDSNENKMFIQMTSNSDTCNSNSQELNNNKDHRERVESDNLSKDEPEEKKSKEMCGICCMGFDKIRSYKLQKVTLLCNHVFHYKCIQDCYRFNSKSYGYSSKKKQECPYCRQEGGPLPNVIELKEMLNKNKKNPVQITFCCGKTNSGNPCSRKAYPNNDGYCRLHKKVNII